VSDTIAFIRVLIEAPRRRARTPVKLAKARPSQPPAPGKVEARQSQVLSKSYASIMNADKTASHASSTGILRDVFLRDMDLHIHRQTQGRRHSQP